MSQQIRRKYIRSTPDPMEYAEIDYSNGKGANWSPMQVALIEEESAMGGCGLVFQRYPFNQCLEKGFKVTIKLGKLEPLFAECMYVEDQGKNLVKAGFKFLE